MMLLWGLWLAAGLALIGLGMSVVGGFILLIRKEKRGWHWMLWVALPSGVLLTPLALIGSLIFLPMTYYGNRAASADFEEALGAPPTAAIKNLRGWTDAGVDSRYIYLGFDRNPQAKAEIEQLLAKAQRVPPNDLLDSDALQGGTPDWWHASHAWTGDKSCRDVAHRNFKNVSGWDNLVLADCPSKGTIYILVNSID